MSDKIDNQIENNSLRAIFNLDGVTLDTPIMGTWDKPVFFGKEIVEFLGFKKPKDALQQHVKPKYKTTLVNEPGLYSLAMHSRLPRAEDFSG